MNTAGRSLLRSHQLGIYRMHSAGSGAYNQHTDQASENNIAEVPAVEPGVHGKDIFFIPLAFEQNVTATGN